MRSKRLDRLSDAVTRVLHERRDDLVQYINDPYYRKMVQEHPEYPPETGFCAAAADALYHLGGGRESGLTRKKARIDENEIHWWVEDREGNIYDPTAGQFAGDEELLESLYLRGRGGSPSSYGRGGKQPPLKLAQKIMGLTSRS